MVQSWNTEPITKSRNNNEVRAYNGSPTKPSTKPNNKAQNNKQST